MSEAPSVRRYAQIIDKRAPQARTEPVEASPLHQLGCKLLDLAGEIMPTAHVVVVMHDPAVEVAHSATNTEPEYAVQLAQEAATQFASADQTDSEPSLRVKIDALSIKAHNQARALDALGGATRDLASIVDRLASVVEKQTAGIASLGQVLEDAMAEEEQDQAPGLPNDLDGNPNPAARDQNQSLG